MAASETSFPHYIGLILDSWPAYHYIKTSGHLGHLSNAKHTWLIDQIDLFFSQNADLEDFEVVDWIEQVMDDNFDLRCEDGSFETVASYLCRSYRFLHPLNADQLAIIRQELHTAAGKAADAQNQSQVVDNEKDQDGSDDECEGEINGDCPPTDTQKINGCIETNMDTSPDATVNCRQLNPAPDPDGWTVIARRKSRK